MNAILKNHFYFTWLHKRPGYALIFNVGSGLFFWLFLWVATPFGINNNNFENALLLGVFLLPLGAAWAIICFVGDRLEKKWLSMGNKSKIKKSLIAWLVRLLLLIHLIYIHREISCEWQCIDVKEYFDIWLASTLLFAICYTPYALYGRYLYFHSLVGAEKVEEGAHLLQGDGKETLSLQLDNILYFQSSDNYVDIFLAKEMQPGKRIVFRCTLKSIEEQLVDFPQFVRIHRSVIVNTRYIVFTSGWNTRKQIAVSFQDYKVYLPVSRSYIETLTTLFARPK